MSGESYRLVRTKDGEVALMIVPQEGPWVSLGAMIDTYLTAHESLGVSRENVTQAFLNSETYDGFTEALSSKGMPESQACRLRHVLMGRKLPNLEHFREPVCHNVRYDTSSSLPCPSNSLI